MAVCQGKPGNNVSVLIWTDYLAKPYTAENLSQILSQCVSPKLRSDNTDNVGITELKHPMEIIEPLKFEETREMMGEHMHLIIDAFKESGTTHIADLHTHLQSADFEALRNAAHALKGSCAALGLQLLFEQCKITEEKCRLGKTDDISKYVEKISILLVESQTAIDRLMREQEAEA